MPYLRPDADDLAGGWTAESGSAMAADTSALYWFAPDSVVHSSGVISAWQDKTGHLADLGQIGSFALPSFDVAGQYLDFGTTQDKIIGNDLAAEAFLVKTSLHTGNAGSIFVVFQPDFSTQSASTSLSSMIVQEGKGSLGSDIAQQYRAVYNRQTYWGAGNEQSRVQTFNRAPAANAFDFSLSLTSTLNDLAEAGPILFELRSDQSLTRMQINDSSHFNETVPNTANWAGAQTGLCLGTGISDDLSALQLPYMGKFYEAFATTDTSTSNLDAIRSELMTKYGIT